MIKVEKTQLSGVLLIKPDIFSDFRGRYVETYNKKNYTDSGIDLDFIQDDISVSQKNVLRGIHGDQKTWKLISCLWGEFYFVVVNCDPASAQFKKWQAFNLSARNYWQVLVPPKFGNAHLALTDEVIFHYKQTTYYDRSGQFTYQWNDPDLGIAWPVKDPILSGRDGGK